MTVYAWVERPGLEVNADDLAAQALAGQLRDETRTPVAVYKRDTEYGAVDQVDYLVMPYLRSAPAGWSCVYVAHGPAADPHCTATDPFYCDGMCNN